MVDADREGNAAIVIVHNESLGRSILSLGGKGINIIATLVAVCEEDEKFKELGLTKGMLSENTLKTIHLKGGNIKLVDNSGNVYAAQLEKKGNINDKR